MERFAGRVALVTGASSGIGAAIAEDLARSGMQVVAVARREDRLQELAEKMSQQLAKGKIFPMKADVSSGEEIERIYRWIDDNLGGVSVVVNNAAFILTQPFQDLKTGDIQKLINTNIGGVMHSCKEALNSMKRHDIRDGHIININSVAGHHVVNVPDFSTTVYCGTKFAVTAFCKGLRNDVKKMEGFKIKVTSISPGGVATEFSPDAWRDVMNSAPKGTFLQAKDVSDAVLYAIASPPEVEVVELILQATGEVL